MFLKRCFILTFSSLAFIVIQGCAPSHYLVSDPQPSTAKYVVASSNDLDQIELVDVRGESDKVFNSGVLKAELRQDKVAIDPVEYLKKHTESELASRGLAVSFAEQTSEAVVKLEKIHMRNHRTNAYTPFITFTTLKAEVLVDGKSIPIAVYIKRGKVPVWSFTEIVEPTLNEPMALLVKEFSAKLAHVLYGAKVADENIDMLINQAASSNSYLDVYQLGFSNNKKVIPTLVELVKHDDEYIRLAAISSLGIVQATEQLDLLKELAMNSDSWSDRGMALKAIADLRTSEANEFLTKQRVDNKLKSDKESKWNEEIFELYL